MKQIISEEMRNRLYHCYNSIEAAKDKLDDFIMDSNVIDEEEKQRIDTYISELTYQLRLLEEELRFS